MMKKYDTVVFDLDGTLLNTLEDLADSVNYILNSHGFPCRTTEEIRSFLGNGVTDLIKRSISQPLESIEYQTYISEFCEHYSKNMQNKTRAYEGIMELLEQLSKEHYKLAIVSNKFDKAVKQLNEVYFGKYIKVAIGESKGVLKKPAPDTVLKAIEELKTTTDKTVYVGDSEVDVRTAKNAGIICVGVTWGFRDREVLEKEGADYIIDKPQELLELLKQKLA